MRNWLLLIFGLFYFPLFGQNITFSAEQLPLREAIQQWEKDYQLLFTFQEELIEEKFISIRSKKQPIDQFFEKIKTQTNLQFEIIDKKFVLISSTSAQQNSGVVSLVLCGKIRDRFTQDPLPFANVYFKKTQKGVYSDEEGFFKLLMHSSDQDSLIISYVGYQSQVFRAADLSQKPCSAIFLEYATPSNELVIVKDYLTDGIQLSKNGVSTEIRPTRVGNLPGQAEPDVLQSIQFLPGISSPDEAAANIHIRGGTPDQNLILWENIPIYHSAHFFGLISAFNPYITDRVSVHRSGFGAEYGGRISGVIDLKSEDFQLPKPEFGAGVNFTHGYIFGKIPSKKNKLSTTFSVRRSHTDLWSSPLYQKLTNQALQGISFGKFEDIKELPDQVDFENDFHFLDANLKLKAQLTEKTSLSTAFFYHQNKLENFFHDNNSTLLQRDSFDLNHAGINVSIQQKWSTKFRTELSGIVSDFDYNYLHIESRLPKPPMMGMEGIPGKNEQLKKRSFINEKQILLNNFLQLTNSKRLKLGYQWSNLTLESGFSQIRANRPSLDEGLNNSGNLHVLFGEFQAQQELQWSYTLGLRSSYFSPLKKLFFEPRLHLKFQPKETISFHANIGQYHQFLSQLIEQRVNRPTLLDNPIWILADDEQIPVVGAWQLQIGSIFSKNAWVLDAQIYYKFVTGLTSSSLGFEPIPQEGYDRGESSIKGFDLLLKKRWKNYQTWWSYSLSKVDYTFLRYSPYSFPAAYDQRHNFRWANLYRLKNWEFSLGFSLNSGTPYTTITDFNLLPNGNNPNLIDIEYSAINDQTTPLQHHLDASFSYRFSPQKSGFCTTLGLSIFNIYNQSNVYLRQYSVSDEPQNPEIEFFDYEGLGRSWNVVLRVKW